MYQRIKAHKRQLVSSLIFAILAWVIGMIIVVLSVLLVFFNNWPSLAQKSTCPQTWSINYLHRIKILQIIYTAMIGVFTLCMCILVVIILIHQLNLKKLWHLSPRYEAVYPLILFIGILCGIIAILYGIKVYLSLIDVIQRYNNKQIREQCINQSQIRNLQQKQTILLLIIIFISLMIQFSILFYCCLPYKYVRTREVNYQKVQQIKLKQRQKLKVIEEQNQEINQLGLQSQIKQKQYTQMGINVNLYTKQQIKMSDMGINVNIQTQKDQNLKAKNKPTIKQIGVGDGVAIIVQNKKKQKGINCVKPTLSDTAIGTHIAQQSCGTDCADLIQQNQISVKSSKLKSLRKTQNIKVQTPLSTPKVKQCDGSDIMMIVQPELYGYYYLENQGEHQDSNERFLQKVQKSRLKSSGRKQYENDRSKYYISSYKKTQNQQSEHYFLESQRSNRTLLKNNRQKYQIPAKNRQNKNSLKLKSIQSPYRLYKQ